MLRAIGIAASPRKGGNSEALLEAALAGAESAGAEVQLVRLVELSFRGCLVCEGCAETGRCVQEDDLAPVHEELRSSQVWILSSPIYFDGLTWLAKAFFDRLWCYTKKKLPGRRAGATIVTYEDKERADYLDVARRTANYFPWFGDFRPVKVLAGCRLGGKNDAGKRPELIKKADSLGKRLVEAVAAGD